MDLGFRWAPDYVEPGYSLGTDSPGILFGDWNPKSYSAPKSEQDRESGPRLARLAESLGFSIEWIDEWGECGQCGRAFRTQSDSYGWKPSYKYADGGVDCSECLLADPGSYVECYLLDNCEQADTFGVDLSELGFTELEAGESGFHPGQNDSPEDMAENCPKDHSFAFQIDSAGQFDMRFSLWTRPYDWSPETEEVKP